MNATDKETFLTRIEGAEELLTDMQESFLNGRSQEIFDVDVNLVSWLISQAKKVEEQQQEIKDLVEAKHHMGKQAQAYSKNWDITKEKLANSQQEIERLRQSERDLFEISQRLRQDIDWVKDLAISCDADGRVIQPHEVLDLLNIR